MKKIKVLFLPIVLIGFLSCNSSNNIVEEGLVARAYDNYLYEKDLADLNLGLLSEEDSIYRLNAYVNKWLADQVLIHEAENHLPENIELESKVENFRQSLLIFDYQKAILKQSLDTIILQEEMIEYYDRYSHDFHLNQDIVKTRFLELSDNPKNLKQVKQFLKGEEDDDIRALSDYAQRNAELYHLNGNLWISLDDILKQIPVQLSGSDLKSGSVLQKKVEGKTFLIVVLDYLPKGAKSPMEFELEHIKSNILNQRKLDILEKMKEDLLKKASSNSSVEVF